MANHTHEFTEASGRAEAHTRAILQAKVMPLTALEVLWSDQVWESVVADFGSTISSYPAIVNSRY